MQELKQRNEIGSSYKKPLPLNEWEKNEKWKQHSQRQYHAAASPSQKPEKQEESTHSFTTHAAPFN